MFNFGHRSNGTVYGVLIDIASGSVGVAIVVSNQKEPLPQILYAHRTTMRLTKYGGRKDENLRRIREALLAASLVLSQEGMQALKEHNPRAHITRMFATCSSPWAYTIARTVGYTNDEPFKVTPSLIQDLVESAEAEMATKLRTESKIGDEGFDIVERATVDVTINDYPVKDPMYKKGVSIGLSHIAGLIPREILSSLHEVQDKLFPGTELRAHTYMLVMYCVMRDLFPRTHSHCIIDVTSEATEFGIVENNLLIENTSVPYGSNTLVRDIMEQTNKPASDVISSLIAHEHAHLESRDALTPYFDAYVQTITEALTKILERRKLPKEVIITVHKPHETLFQTMIERALAQALGSVPTIISIDQKIVQEISKGTMDDIYLALGARFFHKLHGCGEMNQ